MKKKWQGLIIRNIDLSRLLCLLVENKEKNETNKQTKLSISSQYHKTYNS